MPRPPVVVDCDPGLDDAAAIVVADQFADLVAITTVGGNAPLRDVTANALLTTQVFGIDVAVHAGAAGPLVGRARHATEIHGATGFTGPSLPLLVREPSPVPAIEVLIETARQADGLWLVALGPLTNIALALRLAPDIAGRLAGISFMGGSATTGNHTAVAEFNVLADPEAAAAVLESGAKILMAGLDLTYQFVVDDRLVTQLHQIGTAGAAMLAELALSYLDRVERVRGQRQGGLHDPCAVLAVTHPAVVEHTLRRVDVELAGTHTRGMTVVDQRPPAPGMVEGNVWHGHRLDHPQALAALLAAVRAHG